MNSNTLEVKNLKKAFGRVQAVNAVNFALKKGEIFGLLGPNGAGKTTTINLITGILPKDEGEILIDGKSIDNKDYISRIGVCTQEIQLWPFLTCEEQLCFMGKIQKYDAAKIKDRTDFLLRQVGLIEKRKVIAKKLSGGMKRRLHLILSIMHDPDLIILDEPEAGLDPQSRILVRDFIKSLSGSKTVLLTTHNMDEAERISSRVGIIDKGMIHTIDSPDVLRSRICPEDNLEFIYSRVVDLPGEFTINGCQISGENEKVIIRGKNLINNLPGLLAKIIAQFGQPVTFNFRHSTLEDVFIKLTGRSLRE